MNAMPNAERQTPNERNNMGLHSAFGIRHSALSPIPCWLDLLVVAGLCLLISAYRVGQGPLAGTEAHRVLAAHRMVTSGDWVLPKLFDQLYLRKPPLHYWILALAEKLTGRADLAVWRWPSVIEATLTALFLQVITWRWFGRLAGFVSGIAFCALPAIWMQNRTAELDALNTLFCVASTCFIVEMLVRKREDVKHDKTPDLSRFTFHASACMSAWWLPIALAMAFAGATITKGPAGYTMIVGAFLGVPLFNLVIRSWRQMRVWFRKPRIGAVRLARAYRPWKQFGLWLALLIGLIPLAVYGVVAYRTIQQQGITPDWTGVQEAGVGLSLGEWLQQLGGRALQAIPLPLYGFPAVLALPFALNPAIWQTPQKNAAAPCLTDPQRHIVRGLVGTMAMALLFSFLSDLTNARYSYIWLPLFCPLAGAVVAAWRAGVLPRRAGEHIPLCLAIVAVTQTITAVAFSYMAIHRGSDARWLLFAVCSVCALGSFAACVLIHRQQLAWTGIIILPLLALQAIPCAEYGMRDRVHRSHYWTGKALAEHVPPDTVVLTQNVLWDQPEIFYYAGVGVESLPEFPFPGSQPPAAVTEGRWLVLNEWEQEQWRQYKDVTFSTPIQLHHDPLIILTQVEPRKY